MATDSLFSNSLSLIEKAHGVNGGLFCASTKQTELAWNLDIMRLRCLCFQDVEQHPMLGGIPLTFSNMRRNEVSCFKDGLLSCLLMLLNFFETVLLFAHELCAVFHKPSD